MRIHYHRIHTKIHSVIHRHFHIFYSKILVYLVKNRNCLAFFSDRPLDLPLFEIVPGKSQIVFEGDKLPFECRATVTDVETKMFWLRNGEVVETNRTTGVFVLTRLSPDRTVMLHSLVLEELKVPNRGEWLCMVSTPKVSMRNLLRIIPEFRILRLTFHRKPQNTEIG